MTPDRGRDRFTTQIMSCHNLVPAGVLIGPETPDLVESDVLDPHMKSLRLLHTWDAEDRVGDGEDPPPQIAPGLHFHPTAKGHEEMQKGRCLTAEMLTCFTGRDRTLAGETPVVVTQCSTMLRLDKKAQWSLLQEGGHGDHLQMRCPYCVSDECMKPATAHKSVMGATTFMPGENLQQFADRCNIYLWDVLALNWGFVRNHPLFREFETVDDCARLMLSDCRAAMDEYARVQDWWEELDQLPKTGRATQLTDNMLSCILNSFRDWVPDTRERQHTERWYESQRLRPDLCCARFRATEDGSQCPIQEPSTMALTVVGHVFDTRPIHFLSAIGMPIMAVGCCMLHCMMCLDKGFGNSVWNWVHHQSGYNPPTVTCILANMNGCGDPPWSGGNMWKPKWVPSHTVGEPQVSGKPSPGGPACTWIGKNLVALVHAAMPVPTLAEGEVYQGTVPIPQIAAKRERMLRLAENMQSVMADLCRCDWSKASPVELLLRSEMPQRLARMGMQWVLAFDSAGGKEYGGYYLHDVMHHLGELYSYAIRQGFSGLGEVSNSGFEHLHQEVGKPAFWNAWMATVAHSVNGEGAFRDLYRRVSGSGADPVGVGTSGVTTSGGDAGVGGPGVTTSGGDATDGSAGLSEGDRVGMWPKEADGSRLSGLMQQTNHAFQAMTVQLGMRFGDSLCEKCWYLKARCREFGCPGKAPAPAATWGSRREPLSAYQEHMAESMAQCGQGQVHVRPKKVMHQAAAAWPEKKLSMSRGGQPSKRSLAHCDADLTTSLSDRDRMLLPSSLFPDDGAPPPSEQGKEALQNRVAAWRATYVALQPAKRLQLPRLPNRNGESVWVAGQPEPQTMMAVDVPDIHATVTVHPFAPDAGQERRCCVVPWALKAKAGGAGLWAPLPCNDNCRRKHGSPDSVCHQHWAKHSGETTVGPWKMVHLKSAANEGKGSWSLDTYADDDGSSRRDIDHRALLMGYSLLQQQYDQSALTEHNLTDETGLGPTAQRPAMTSFGVPYEGPCPRAHPYAAGTSEDGLRKMREQFCLLHNVRSGRGFSACPACRASFVDYSVARSRNVPDQAPNPGGCDHPFTVSADLKTRLAVWKPAKQAEWVQRMPVAIVFQWTAAWGADVVELPLPCKSTHKVVEKWRRQQLTRMLAKWSTDAQTQVDCNKMDRQSRAQVDAARRPSNVLGGGTIDRPQKRRATRAYPPKRS